MYALPSPNHYDPATVTHYRTPRGGNPMDRMPSPDQINAMFDVLEEHRQRRQEPEEMPELPAPHYHVVAFIPGCLNDYDSGPYDSYLTAQAALESLVQDYEDDSDATAHQTGPGRYEIVYDTIHGTGYVLKVEECTEDCDPEEDY